MHIYTITNKINGKVYVGKTKNKYRFSGHVHKALKRKSKSAIAAAILKYGPEAFVYEIIEKCDSELSLNEREMYWIDKLGTFMSNNGYNMTKGGDGGIGKSVSKETRIKISQALKGRQVADETRKKISQAQKGIPKSPEAILAARNGRAEKGGWVITYEANRKRSAALLGRPKSKEHNMKVSLANKGKKRSEEAKKNMSESRKGKRALHVLVPVVGFFNNGNRIVFACVRDAAKHTKILETSISNCITGRSKTAGGIKWSYLNK